ESPRRFRYVRFLAAESRQANYAEIEFYGKRDRDAPEERLTGNIIGAPAISADDAHPYTHAMDGNLETWFEKPRPRPKECWVGLDLGKPHYITRVLFCPRSDTNFILTGDTYELFYRDGGAWYSAGKQTAATDALIFDGVPAGTVYWLRNLSRGREERIFTYEDGKQVWW
ncbi:MAG: transglutaminase domain-containing protein, partial [Bacteroidales bacterium]|nr:transglutaminase domain-containing protein [Bacteroidales bacterium]